MEVMSSPDDTLQKLPTSPPVACGPEGGHVAQRSFKGLAMQLSSHMIVFQLKIRR